jgi:ACT domain-containing protein
LPFLSGSSFYATSDTVSHLSRTLQAEGRDKAMDTEIQDRVGMVIDKLSVLDDLFAMYWVAKEKVGFQDKSRNGIRLIIGGCVKEIEESGVFFQ